MYASSSSVYGGNSKLPFSEIDNVDSPLNLYAASKKCNELLAFAFSHINKIRSTGLRFFSVYGPWGRPDMAPIIFANAILKNTEIKVNNFGEMSRDFTFIDDIVQGVVASVDLKMGFEVINLGNSNPIRLDALIASIGEVVQKEPIIRQLPDQPGDVPMTFADVSKAKQLLDYDPQTKIVDGIRKFWAWKQTYVVGQLPL